MAVRMTRKNSMPLERCIVRTWTCLVLAGSLFNLKVS